MTTRQDTGTSPADTAAHPKTHTAAVLRGLEHDRSSERLRWALAAGTAPDPAYVRALVQRCAIEPDFFVREMLTWALTRHPTSMTLPALLDEVRSGGARARSQALHTLSKLGDRQAWPVITRALLTDPDDDVARTVWRTAVVLVPEGAEAELATVLATQLGRGEQETQRSLSRALVELGEAALPALAGADSAADRRVRTHALATRRLLHDPDAGFTFAVEEAKRVVALDGRPEPEGG